MKLFVRGLMLGDAPWKYLMVHKLLSIWPTKCRQWFAHTHFILYASNIQCNDSSLWWGIWKAWLTIRQHLSFEQSNSTDTITRQSLFSNRELVDTNGQMFEDSNYSFGCHWPRSKFCKLKTFGMPYGMTRKPCVI